MGEEGKFDGPRWIMSYGGKGAISSCLSLFPPAYGLKACLPTWKWQEHFKFPVEGLRSEPLGEQPTGSWQFEEGPGG